MKASSSTPRPISLHPDTVDKCDGPDQFQNFDRMFRSIITVPKVAIEKEEANWKRKRKKQTPRLKP